ncbi:MAG: hypothetical protein WBJ82_10560 [Tepidanaerobacteraceae bacterium]|uniref:hypothetical protein n=1 Tax=Tepidanaerobacter sp. GT38 TaxID=2722793 RepID=UPI000A850FC9|nr:hypothetical protein [Tepidanaerobacter sp. GT38]MCG1011577.1 hypothetical protein [Tepidanaerobacter sp. GT38]HQA60557.1 hypothetical protein [Tepidanaerobacteraceae bacterium]
MIVFGPVPSRRLGRSVGINNMNITAVHPMKKPAVETLLQKCNSNWNVVEKLIDEQKIIKFEYQNETFYMRKLSEQR